MSDPSSRASLPSPTAPVVLRVFGRTDVGQIREHNEDNFLIADLTRRSRGLLEEHRVQVLGPQGSLLGVCDGMGGAAAGEVASQLAVDIIFERLCADPPPSTREDLAHRVVHAVEEAGIRIFNEARADRSRRGMGTTATIAALLDRRLYLAQVGDSRAYILRRGALVQVTRDQSLVTQLIEAGQLTEEEAETFEHNNIILQALGTAETVQVDLTFVDLHRGDRLLLCSDGLSGMIRSEEIRSVLLEGTEPLATCKELTDRANRAGGHDNITVIVADFDGEGLPPLGEQEEALQYRKCMAPEEAGDGLMTVRVGPVSTGPTTGAPPFGPADAAVSAGPRSRVAHTMVSERADLERVDAAWSGAPTQEPSQPCQPTPLPEYDPNRDPVILPYSGLPPILVLMLVVFAILLAAVAGYFIIH